MIQIQPVVLMIISTIIIGIIGTLATIFINKIINTQKELSKSIQKLNISLTGLNGMIAGMKDMNDLFAQNCKERHDRIEKDFEKIENKVESLLH